MRSNTATPKRFGASSAAFAVAAALAFALSAALVLSSNVGITNSYFTTYADAKGSVAVDLSEKTTITEEVDSDLTKHVTITNVSDSTIAVYVRAKAFGPDSYQLSYTLSDGWSAGNDGYYYYATPLEPGQSTTELLVAIEGVPGYGEAEDGDNFNVVVVYETTPVRINDDGTQYADWSTLLKNDDLVYTQGGGQ